MPGRYPTPAELDQLRAYLWGHLDEGRLHDIGLGAATDLLRRAAPPGVDIDGRIASRLLGRLRFRRSYRPEDTAGGAIVYRKEP